MATSVTLTKIPLNGGVKLPELQALAADGALVDFTAQDTKTVVLVENTGAAGELTFAAGSGFGSAAPLTAPVDAGAKMAFVLESAAFKSAGKLRLTGPVTLKVGALLLP